MRNRDFCLTRVNHGSSLTPSLRNSIFRSKITILGIGLITELFKLAVSMGLPERRSQASQIVFLQAEVSRLRDFISSLEEEVSERTREVKNLTMLNTAYRKVRHDYKCITHARLKL